MEENGPDLEKVIQAGHLAKVSLYRQLLKKVANGAPLCAYELRTIRDLGAQLEAIQKGEAEPRAPATDLDRVSRNDLAKYVFRVTPQTISKWCLKEDMPRNDDGTFSVGDSLEWALDRAGEANTAKPDLDEAAQWLTEFRKERALKAKMERQHLEGRLFPKEEVLAAWCGRYAYIKRYLMAWSKRLPGRLAGMDERSMIGELDDEVRFLLSLLSRPGKFTELEDGLDEDLVERPSADTLTEDSEA